MKKNQYSILIISLLLTTFVFGQSSKFTSFKTGDWDDPTVWTESGSDVDDIPDEDDTVEIQSGLDTEFLDKIESIFIYFSEGKLIYSSNSIKSSIDLSGFINGIYIVLLNEEANNSYINKISL
jgi:hypothetical protein